MIESSHCCFVFFFFKQKTAYEMRISDWSSDVCSSDLQHGDLVLDSGTLAGDRRGTGARARQLRLRAAAIDARGDAAFIARADPIVGTRISGDGAVEQRLLRVQAAQPPVIDWKSVVEGERESVRVDLGGRRCITKKKYKRYSIN